MATCALLLLLQCTVLDSPQTTIRVKFSDRSQLEKTFQSTDKIKSVYAFVRNSLREDVQSIKFVLCAFPHRYNYIRPYDRRRPDASETRIQSI